MNSQSQEMGIKLQRGFGIVEALVALYLFNTIVLATLGLQHYSFRMANDTKLLFHARLLALDGAGRLYANNGLNGQDWADWQYQVTQALPQGVGEIKKKGNLGYQVIVSWQPDNSVMTSCPLKEKLGKNCVAIMVIP